VLIPTLVGKINANPLEEKTHINVDSLLKVPVQQRLDRNGSINQGGLWDSNNFIVVHQLKLGPKSIFKEIGVKTHRATPFGLQKLEEVVICAQGG
jgi:hypothetical protein